jgi:hypothetical protein
MRFQKTLVYLLSDNFERSSQNYQVVSSQNLPGFLISTNCENGLVPFQINHLYGLNTGV